MGRRQLPAGAESATDGHAFGIRLERVRIAALAHRREAPDRQGVAEVHRVVALVGQAGSLRWPALPCARDPLEERRAPLLRAAPSPAAKVRRTRRRPALHSTSAALRELAELPPVAPEGDGVPERKDRLTVVDGPRHAAPEVATVNVETPEPVPVPGTDQVGLGRLGQRQVVQRVPSLDLLGLARIREARRCVLANDRACRSAGPGGAVAGLPGSGRPGR